MSAENKTSATRVMEMYVHHCIAPGCREWGSFGYDRGRGVTDWWCREHVPRDENDERKMSY